MADSRTQLHVRPCYFTLACGIRLRYCLSTPNSLKNVAAFCAMIRREKNVVDRRTDVSRCDENPRASIELHTAHQATVSAMPVLVNESAVEG